MTPVWNNINAKYLALRKERNPANAATIGDILNKALEADRQDVKMLNDLVAKVVEAQLYRDLLPQQMTADELKATIAAIVAEVQAVTKKDTGKVMKVLRDRHEGVYDGKTAIALVAEVLV